MLSSATGSLKKETAVFLKNGCRKRIGKYISKKVQVSIHAFVELSIILTQYQCLVLKSLFYSSVSIWSLKVKIYFFSDINSQEMIY